jgi:DNA-binding NtrC family response regulator
MGGFMGNGACSKHLGAAELDSARSVDFPQDAPLALGPGADVRSQTGESLVVQPRLPNKLVLEPHESATCGLIDMVGNSTVMRRVYERIRIVAATRSTVLITGESGTGKELVARALHELSPRRVGPFVALNCAAIPKELAESELFGHFAGAFTGAARKRTGRMMAADGGTLLIDEIGEMDRFVQAKLLRVLETRSVTPVGANDEQPMDVRIVAATHRNLHELVSEGSFREDLFYRLNVIRIALPPLRQRVEDIPLLADAFLRKLNKEHAKSVCEISAEAMQALLSHRWPGNVRELYNALAAAVVMAQQPVIELCDLPPEIHEFKKRDLVLGHRTEFTLSALEREAIRQRLNQTGGSRQKAAKLLGISTRALANKMRRHGLERAQQSRKEAALTER